MANHVHPPDVRPPDVHPPDAGPPDRDGHRSARPGLLPALPEGVGRLIVLRGVRSFAQGCLAVAFPLYLLRIGISTVAVGALFTATAVASAGMTLLVGVLADRWGRKPFVMAFALLTAVGGAAFLATRDFWVVAAVAILSGFGRGGLGVGGAQGGPFAPALQALLAEKTGERQRTPLFALASGVGAYCSAAGALLSGLAEWLATPARPLLGYQVLFALTLLSGAVMAIALVPLGEGPVRRERRARTVLSARSWRAVSRLSLAGAVNGLGWGFIMGFTPIWFHLRFGVGAAAVGAVTAVTALMTGPGFAVSTRLARRWGEVQVITVFRLAAPVLLAVLPLMASFDGAAAAYVLGLLCVVAPMPLRQSFAMGVVDQNERAAAVGIRATAARLPSAVSPTLTGYLLNAGDFDLPFWCTAVCVGVNGLLYWLFFGRGQAPVGLAPELERNGRNGPGRDGPRRRGLPAADGVAPRRVAGPDADGAGRAPVTGPDADGAGRASAAGPASESDEDA